MSPLHTPQYSLLAARVSSDVLLSHWKHPKLCRTLCFHSYSHPLWAMPLGHDNVMNKSVVTFKLITNDSINYFYETRRNCYDQGNVQKKNVDLGLLL